MRPLLLVCLFAALMTSACATAVRGTTEKIVFVSDPAGARMTASVGQSCITPCTLEIERSETFTASFELDGHETLEVFVDTEVADEVAATTAANILLTPIVAIPVALVVDAASGANLNHTPNPVAVKLTAVGGATDGDGAAVVAEADADNAATALKPAAADEAIPFDPTREGGSSPAATETEPAETKSAREPEPVREVPFWCKSRPNAEFFREECRVAAGGAVNAAKPVRPDPKPIPAWCKANPNLVTGYAECRGE